ncbi:MAG: hypothetical protein AABX47_04795, partial [Nanoarchaeota archaeon]
KSNSDIVTHRGWALAIDTIFDEFRFKEENRIRNEVELGKYMTIYSVSILFVLTFVVIGIWKLLK